MSNLDPENSQLNPIELATFAYFFYLFTQSCGYFPAIYKHIYHFLVFFKLFIDISDYFFKMFYFLSLYTFLDTSRLIFMQI